MNVVTAVRRAKRLGAVTLVGITMVAIIVLLTILSPIISPYDPIASNANRVLLGSSWEHWLGTDAYGRDVLSRTLEGGRFALLVSLLATSISVAVGTFVGTIASSERCFPTSSTPFWSSSRCGPAGSSCWCRPCRSSASA